MAHPPSSRSWYHEAGPELRAGFVAVAPMLLGVAPFGVVAGATPVANGMPWDVAVGFSTLVFAGASQLVAIDVLIDGGSAAIAVIAACAVNLRLVLYSASIAPYLARTRTRRRLGMAYLLTDQVYALSVVRWAGDARDVGDGPGVGGDAVGGPGVGGSGPAVRRERSRRWFYLGVGLSLWTTWQLSTVAGILMGNVLPSDVHLEFAVPLVFLVLLVPTLVDRPAVVAAAVGGASAVVAAEMGAGPTSIVVGAVAGVVAGAIADGGDGPGGGGSGGGAADGGSGAGDEAPA